MEKIILVDGNNLIFRSYFATAYTGNVMKNSKGFPTNALFGFVNMINKIVAEEKPTYILVAFDKGKTFRHNEYNEYKGGRNETPDDLKVQMPLARQILTYMGIKYYEIDNYEADDIIGTFAEFCNKDDNFIGTIVSSDKDLLQLISDDIDIKLLKTKDYIRYTKETFKKEYGIDPIKVIDLKALMGDASDNIPGVKGIGEKTALKLLNEYGSLDEIYNHVDELTPKLKEKLLSDKDNAYMSYHLATIVRNVPVDINLDDIKLREPDSKNLYDMYANLEFRSLMKKTDHIGTNLDVKMFSKGMTIEDDIVAIYMETDNENYHIANILGFGIFSKNSSFYMTFDDFKDNISIFDNKKILTYDVKKLITALKWHDLTINNIIFDTMIAGFLVDYNVKDDISYIARAFDYKIDDKQNIETKSLIKAKFIYETKDLFIDKLKEMDLLNYFNNIEFPLAFVLSDMEYSGVNVDRDCLMKMNDELVVSIEDITKKIYDMAGCEFNISSPKQLSDVLFVKLGLSHGKKSKMGFSTSIDVLNKLKGQHPIIDLIIEYRLLTKIQTTYIMGLLGSILKDKKVHTIYTQVLTRTGRLSSIEPNLQNIPIRNEFGKLIRKAFVPSEDSVILSADYSQIELRILSHMASVESLIDAFNKDIDIHTKTASDIFKIDTNMVDSNMRRIAKAVNFGIIYGISSYGLAENLGIRVKEAKEFIDNYLAEYPGITDYMERCKKEAYENGFVKTLFNRKREIPELKNKNYMVRTMGERMALNTPIQGTSADIIKKAMIEVFQAFKEHKLKSKMILQVHDELVFDCKKEELDIVISLVKDIMENTYKMSVPLRVDINYGDNWYLAK